MMTPLRRLRTTTSSVFGNRLHALGLMVPGPDGAPYWNTEAAYALTPETSAKWLEAADAVHALCLQAIDAVVAARDYGAFGIESVTMVAAIERSWRARETAFVGRMDFSFGADGLPKLLDYEADGPLCLPEASYLQWEWFEAWKAEHARGGEDQENLIYEKLLEMWRKLRLGGRLCIASGGEADGNGAPLDTAERFTAEWLAETAGEAGLTLHSCGISQVGWDTEALRFTDAGDEVLELLIKLYPWHWMEREQNVEALPVSRTRILPQAWTRLLADKALLAVLWRMFPDSPYLLPAALEPGVLDMPTVSKPRRGWDGEGVSLPGQPAATGAGPLVWQAHCSLPVLDGVHAAPSVWMVDGAAAGLSFRESITPVTRIDARFVPHILAS
jgi:glutathionylspermidine synthase